MMTETRRARQAFSLVIVLLIAVASMSLLGGLLYMFDTFAGVSRAAANDAEVYNYLQSQIEDAKSELRRYMLDEKKKVQARTPPDVPEELGSLDDLDYIKVYKKNDDGTWDAAPFYEVDRDEKVGMRTGRLTVNIYDMQHTLKVPSTAAKELIASLPPTLLFSGKAEGGGDSIPPLDPDGEPPTPPGSSGSGGADHAGVYLIRASIDFGGGLRKTIDTAVVQRDGSPKE
jgi:hypothetical protein